MADTTTTPAPVTPVKKAFRSVIRNPRGQLQVVFVDAETGQILDDVTGYTIIGAVENPTPVPNPNTGQTPATPATTTPEDTTTTDTPVNNRDRNGGEPFDWSAQPSTGTGGIGGLVSAVHDLQQKVTGGGDAKTGKSTGIIGKAEEVFGNIGKAISGGFTPHDDSASSTEGGVGNTDPYAGAVNVDGLAKVEVKTDGKRNLAIKPQLAQQIQAAVTSVYGPDYHVDIMSGAQPDQDDRNASNSVGTRRHGTGVAADVKIYAPDGHNLTGQELVPLAQHWLGADIGSVGFPANGSNFTHLDLIGGNVEGSVPLQGKEGKVWSYGALSPVESKALGDSLNHGVLPKYVVPPDKVYELQATGVAATLPENAVNNGMTATNTSPKPLQTMGEQWWTKGSNAPVSTAGTFLEGNLGDIINPKAPVAPTPFAGYPNQGLSPDARDQFNPVFSPGIAGTAQMSADRPAIADQLIASATGQTTPPAQQNEAPVDNTVSTTPIQAGFTDIGQGPGNATPYDLHTAPYAFPSKDNSPMDGPLGPSFPAGGGLLPADTRIDGGVGSVLDDRTSKVSQPQFNDNTALDAANSLANVDADKVFKDAYLQQINKAEGAPAYNQLFGYKTVDDLTQDHPNRKVFYNQGKDYSTAAGYGQINYPTWSEYSEKVGGADFSNEDDQKKVMWQLAADTYSTNTGRDLLADLKSGNPDAIAGAYVNVNNRWASLPGGKQPQTDLNTLIKGYTQAIKAYDDNKDVVPAVKSNIMDIARASSAPDWVLGTGRDNSSSGGIADIPDVSSSGSSSSSSDGTTRNRNTGENKGTTGPSASPSQKVTNSSGQSMTKSEKDAISSTKGIAGNSSSSTPTRNSGLASNPDQKVTNSSGQSMTKKERDLIGGY